MSEAPQISVIMPVYNALRVGLGIAVRDILKQRETHLELIAVDDGSSDGSREFLVAVAEALGERGEIELGPVAKRAKLVHSKEGEEELEQQQMAAPAAEATAAATATAVGAAEASPVTVGKHPKLLKLEAKRNEPAAAEGAVPAPAIESLTVEQVAEAAVAPNRLRVVCACHGGQGAAMNLALSLAQGALIGQMESDDERPEDCFARLQAELEAHPDWTGACSTSALIGWDRGGGQGTQREREGGMARYVAWQNALRSPEEIAANRFVEIPALHQSCLYPRATIQVLGGYRSDDEEPPWPVDMDFWLKWHEAGHRMGKVPEALYRWRQHPSSDSRHREEGRCSLESLRRLKVHYLCRPRGPCHHRRVQVWSVGYTREAYVAELQASGVVQEVMGVEWNSKLGQGSPPLPDVQACHGGGERWLRLFAYGAPAARRRVRHAFRDWDPAHDWFIA